jgi:AraC-like DNA-binding protein
MLYREYQPHPALARHVACMWAARVQPSGGVTHTHRVLPDNCIDILWQDAGGPGFAVGMMSSAIQVASSGPVRTVAVRFKPGAAGLFLGLPLHALTDQRADIDQLWGRSSADRLSNALWSTDLSDLERIALIEAELLSRLRIQPADGGDLLIRRALSLLDASQGNLRIEELAAQLHISRQHMAAQFRTRVGLSPKLYARIARFRRATTALRAATVPSPDFAQLALECGYFDQSHLIHDFQDFAGSTPERFLTA